ncbi:MAG: hypothetical protein WCQ41_01710 [Bacillota bacterium]
MKRIFHLTLIIIISLSIFQFQSVFALNNPQIRSNYLNNKKIFDKYYTTSRSNLVAKVRELNLKTIEFRKKAKKQTESNSLEIDKLIVSYKESSNQAKKELINAIINDFQNFNGEINLSLSEDEELFSELISTFNSQIQKLDSLYNGFQNVINNYKAEISEGDYSIINDQQIIYLDKIKIILN